MGIQATYDALADIGTVPTCKTCGSERVVKDAWACWNPESGLWELEAVFDHEHCHQCEGETTMVWNKAAAVPRLRIRELNDLFRTEGRGSGSVVISTGIRATGREFLVKAAEAVQSFTAFTDENDPWGEHDYGSVEVDGQKVFWKIDYFSPDLATMADNPANEGQTHRVLTIIRAEEC